MQHIKDLSNGRVSLGAGTLYGAINKLLEKGWIISVGNDTNSRKKEYVITTLGKSMINDEIIRLDELLINGKAVTGGGHNGNHH